METQISENSENKTKSTKKYSNLFSNTNRLIKIINIFLIFVIAFFIIYNITVYNNIDYSSNFASEELDKQTTDRKKELKNKLLFEITNDLYLNKVDSNVIISKESILTYLYNSDISDKNFRTYTLYSDNKYIFLKNFKFSLKCELNDEYLPEMLENEQYNLVKIKGFIEDNYEVLFVGTYKLRTEFKYDLLFLLLSIITFLVFFLFYLPKIGFSKERDDKFDLKTLIAKKDIELEQFFFYDMIYASEKAKELYSRSTLMLVTGLVMALIGVIVFYFTLSPADEFEYKTYLIQSIRPTLMLLFIETVAWFLIRQYRFLIEDYKIFHKLYLKRSNLYITFKTLNKHDKEKDLDLLFCTALLNDDLYGKISKDDTTEQLENIKLIDSNPVVDIAKLLIEKVQK